VEVNRNSPEVDVIKLVISHLVSYYKNDKKILRRVEGVEDIWGLKSSER